MRYVLLALASILAIYGLAQAPRKTSDLDTAVVGYEKWTAANKELYEVVNRLYLLCRPLTPEEQAKLKKDFHSGFIKVRVNDIGKDAMFSGKPFPVGTVIVKEKHLTETAPTSLCTVMRKREKGYNPGCGDWEFGVLDNKETLTEKGKIADCVSCHKEQAKLDFTFRRYVDKK